MRLDNTKFFTNKVLCLLFFISACINRIDCEPIPNSSSSEYYVRLNYQYEKSEVTCFSNKTPDKKEIRLACPEKQRPDWLLTLSSQNQIIRGYENPNQITLVWIVKPNQKVSIYYRCEEE